MAYPEISTLTFGDVNSCSGRGGFKRAPLTLPTGDALSITAPVSCAPFGVGEWPVKEGEGSRPKDVEDAGLRAFLEGLDRRMVEAALQNAQLWLNKQRASSAMVEVLYSPSLKPSSKPGLYAPTLKVSLTEAR